MILNLSYKLNLFFTSSSSQHHRTTFWFFEIQIVDLHFVTPTYPVKTKWLLSFVSLLSYSLTLSFVFRRLVSSSYDTALVLLKHTCILLVPVSYAASYIHYVLTPTRIAHWHNITFPYGTPFTGCHVECEKMNLPSSNCTTIVPTQMCRNVKYFCVFILLISFFYEEIGMMYNKQQVYQIDALMFSGWWTK